MSQVDVMSDSANGSFEVLVASCLDLSVALGFLRIVAVASRGIGNDMTELADPFNVLSGGTRHVSHTAAIPTAPAPTIELIGRSFDELHEVATKFLSYAGASVVTSTSVID